MSSNENTSLPDDSLDAQALAVRPSALSPSQGWQRALTPEFAQPPEFSAPTLTPYLHGLRRHWIVVTAIGLLCAAIATVAMYFGWGPNYTALAVLQVSSVQRELLQSPEQQRFVQQQFDVYKDTQRQLLLNRFVLTAALRAPEVADLPSLKREDDDEQWLQDELSVTFPGQAELMQVSMSGRDRNEVTALVKAVVEAYLSEVVDVERRKRNDRLNELETVYTMKETEIKSKREEMTSLAELLGASVQEGVALRQQLVTQEYADLRRNLVSVQYDVSRLRAELRIQQSLLDLNQLRDITAAEVKEYTRGDPAATEARRNLYWQSMTQAELQRLVKDGGNSPHVQNLMQGTDSAQSHWEQLEAAYKEEIRADDRAEILRQIQEMTERQKVLADQEKDLVKVVADKKDEAEKLSATSIELEMMRSKIADLEQVRRNIAEQWERLKVEIRSAPRVTLLQQAEVPESEVGQSLRITLTVVAALGAFCIPGICITWWDTRAKRINSADDVSRGLGMMVIGSVPMIPSGVIRRLGSPTRRHQQWYLRLIESIDGIAARLLRRAELDQTRVVLISSASSSEGKTTLATQLAMSLARNGRKTVFVDFDLRKPTLDQIFGMSLAPGICDVLRRERDLAEMIHATGTDNLSVVTAGSWDDRIRAALSNGGAEPILEELRQEFEFVIIDASPILSVADTRFVSQHADTVILSVFRDVSQGPRVQAACEILDAFGVRSLEAVVTGPTENLIRKGQAQATGATE